MCCLNRLGTIGPPYSPRQKGKRGTERSPVGGYILEFDVRALGPLEVRVDGDPVALGGPRQRALLAALIVNGGSGLPLDVLTDFLWPEDLPDTGTKTVQVYLSRFRKSFGRARDRIEVASGSYRLRLEPGELDIDRFRTSLAEARQHSRDGDDERAAQLLNQALHEWRGPPFADVAGETFVQPDIARLEELRLGAQEDLIAIRLRGGLDHADGPDIEALAKQHPLREKLWQQWARALYREGRQADALDALRTLRNGLHEDLGLDPMPETEALEAAILNQEAWLTPASAPDVHLPAPASSIVGREPDLAGLAGALRDRRLVSLIAPAGCGKTRLALELAWRSLPEFPDGVWFIELASVTDPALVPATVADGLGATGDSTDPTELVAGFLRGRKCLVVLDNFEQVLGAAAFVTALLARAPDARILVTSRVALDARGERIRRLEPLRTSARDGTPAPAVELFLERAADAGVDLPRHPHTMATVEHLVRGLDGLPLAIELAAARLRVLSLERVAAGLADRLALLTGGPRDAPERQQTLRAAIGWSFELLDPSLRRLVAELSVFAGGFDSSAVRAVASVEAGDVEGGLHQLVGHSLLARASGGAEDRYSMLETIRDYASSQLTESGSRRASLERHVAYYVALAEEAEPELLGSAQGEWLKRLELENDNVRAAMSACGELGLGESLHRIVGALWWFWPLTGHLTEGARWADAALAQFPQVPDRLLARSMFTAGTLALWAARKADIKPTLERSLELFTRVGDVQGRGRALHWLGCHAIETGDLDAGGRLMADASSSAEQAGDVSLKVWISINSHMIPLARDELSAARAVLDRGIEASAQLGDLHSLATCHGNAAWLALLAEDFTAAERNAREAMALFAVAGDPAVLVGGTAVLAAIAIRGQDIDDARALMRQSLPYVSSLGFVEATVWFNFCALVATSSGMPDAAAHLFGTAAKAMSNSSTSEAPAARRYWHVQRELTRGLIGDEAFDLAYERGASSDQATALLIADQVLNRA
jgi:predicted ATPase/DNA-binding SARP family transcriptional activator